MNSSLALLRSALAALCLATLAAGTHAQPKAAAKPDPAKGKDIAGGACAACHGADGNSTIPANPKLAGQHAESDIGRQNHDRDTEPHVDQTRSIPNSATKKNRCGRRACKQDEFR